MTVQIAPSFLKTTRSGTLKGKLVSCLKISIDLSSELFSEQLRAFSRSMSDYEVRVYERNLVIDCS